MGAALARRLSKMREKEKWGGGGPPPPFDDVLDLIRSRLHLVPRYRQRLGFPPLNSARPVWVDDPDFNILYHVRQTALPSPGDQRQLLRLVSRVFSQQLDRDRPLWELWMVEGLEDGRWALLSKTHHALIDGVSGVDLATVLFDLMAEPFKLARQGTALIPGGLELAHLQHRLVYESVMAGDGPGANAAMYEHLESAEERLNQLRWSEHRLVLP